MKQVGAYNRVVKENHKKKKGQHGLDVWNDTVLFVCRNDYTLQQTLQRLPEDFPVSAENICCAAPVWEYSVSNQR